MGNLGPQAPASGAHMTPFSMTMGSVTSMPSGTPSLVNAPNPMGIADPTQDPSNWKEFADKTGRPYFHCKVTNSTTYEKPDCLKSRAEKTLPPCKWKEYPMADGRKYFSDGERSVWEEPPELTEYKAKLKAMEAGDVSRGLAEASPEGASVPAASVQAESTPAGSTGLEAAVERPATSGSRRVAPQPTMPTEFKNDEERKACFVEMLRDTGITSAHKWGEVNKICKDDPRSVSLISLTYSPRD